MKRKIGEIYNKPIVIGDKNLITKNEVHKDEISGGSKEYDDLNTFLYYDDRIITVGGVGGLQEPLCGLILMVLMTLKSHYPEIHATVKMDNTEGVFGMNFGNYLPIEAFFKGSGFVEEFISSMKGISIPKYVFPELTYTEDEEFLKIDKVHIFDLAKLVLDGGMGNIIELIKSQPTITREEFFDLLK